MGASPSSTSYNDDKIGLPLIQGNADCANRKTKPRIYTSEITKKCKVGDIIMTVRLQLERYQNQTMLRV